jgi:hypothetical protein
LFGSGIRDNACQLKITAIGQASIEPGDVITTLPYFTKFTNRDQQVSEEFETRVIAQRISQTAIAGMHSRYYSSRLALV